MSIDLGREPNYDLLLQALIEKTRAGKLRWQETAEENTYLAAVKGERTFQVHSNDQGSVQVLTVRDGDGSVAIKYVTGNNPTFSELHQLARRVALRVDEKIDSTLELLNSL
jgi:hypothetical protein